MSVAEIYIGPYFKILLMTKYAKKTLFLFFALKLLVACNSTQNETVIKRNEATSPANIFGLYSYFVTGYKSVCESVKHALLLDADSTFILKIYCHSDSSSLFPATIKTGKFVKLNDSIFNFIYPDNTSFKAEFFKDNSIQLIPEIGKEAINYSFRKEPTTDEHFWQGSI